MNRSPAWQLRVSLFKHQSFLSWRWALPLVLSPWLLLSSARKSYSFTCQYTVSLPELQTQGCFCAKFYLLTSISTSASVTVGNRHLEFLLFTGCRYSTDNLFSPYIPFFPLCVIKIWHVHSFLVLPSCSTSALLELRATSWKELAWPPGDCLLVWHLSVIQLICPPK